MDRRKFTVALSSLLGLAQQGTARGAPAESDAAAGVRMALQRGADAAVGLLGRVDGFWGNPQVRIGLPKGLAEPARLLKITGQGKRLDELVLAMNRAAEAAVPRAQPLLVRAVKDMSVEDALGLVRGEETAVTRFFAAKTRVPLAQAFLPVVRQATEKVELAARYNALAGRVAGLGTLKDEETSVERYVTARALDGLYWGIAEQERQLRADPLKTGSALLAKVFGGRLR